MRKEGRLVSHVAHDCSQQDGEWGGGELGYRWQVGMGFNSSWASEPAQALMAGLPFVPIMVQNAPVACLIAPSSVWPHIAPQVSTSSASLAR
jgi:hypothetical protein